MNAEEKDRLIEDHLEYLKTGDDGLFWTFEKLADMASEREWETLWQISTELVRRIPEGAPALLAKVAAGPLEDLLRAAGDSYFARIESLARKDAKFRLALTGVWGLERDQPLLWKRLQPMLESVKDPL